MTSRISYYYAGILVLLSLVIGGGTFQGLWTDHLFQIACIPALLLGAWYWNLSNLETSAKLLCLLVLAIVLFQFFPIERTWPNLENFESSRTLFLTTIPIRSLEGAVFTLSLLGFGVFISTMPRERLDGLLQFFMLGLMLNVVIAFLQLSYSENIRQETFLPYEITGGLFANQNHFSTLVFASIPLLAWHFLGQRSRPLLFLVSILVLVLIQFAVGSRAGMAIAILVAIMSVVWLFLSGKSWKVPVLLFFVIVFVTSAILFLIFVGYEEVDPVRAAVAKRTWYGFLDNWFFGTGLGSFPMVDPLYEPPDEIKSTNAQRAHNDLFQLLLEFGVFVVPVILFFVVILIKNSLRDVKTQMYILSIATIIAHSVIDFPLRTYGISLLFVYLIIYIFANRKYIN